MKFSMIAAPLIVFIEVIVWVNFFNYGQAQVRELDQEIMDIQVNYCIEAATDRMLAETSDLELNYQDMSSFNVNPQVAYEYYVMLLTRNLGYVDSYENRQIVIDNNIPFFAVCEGDGMYIWYKTPVNVGDAVSGNEVSTGFEMVCTPKLPYTYIVDDDTAYYYNLSMETYTEYTLVPDQKTVNGEVMRNGKKEYPTTFKLHDITADNRDMSKFRLSYAITDRLTQALWIGTDGRSDVVVNLQSVVTDYVTNELQGITCISALVDNADNATADKFTFGVGGAVVTSTKNFIVYYLDGNPDTLYYLPAVVFREYAGKDYRLMNTTEYKVCKDAIECAKYGAYLDTRFY